MTDNAIRNMLIHMKVMIHTLALVSSREVQKDCTMHLLRAWAQQAQTRGTSHLFWSNPCFYSPDGEAEYKQQWAWVSSQPLLLQQEIKTSKKSPLSWIDVSGHVFTFSPFKIVLQIWFVPELTHLSFQNLCTPFCSRVITRERFDYIWTWVQTCPRQHMVD